MSLHWPWALTALLGEHYKTLANIRTSGGERQITIEETSRKAAIDVDRPVATGWLDFIKLGIEHIITGYDHLLFLVALLATAKGAWSVVRIVTAFTLAHSVTLALAVLDVVILPDRLVEAVIALSIAFVAAENLFLSPVVSRRWVVSQLVRGISDSAIKTVCLDCAGSGHVAGR